MATGGGRPLVALRGRAGEWSLSAGALGATSASLSTLAGDCLGKRVVEVLPPAGMYPSLHVQVAGSPSNCRISRRRAPFSYSGYAN